MTNPIDIVTRLRLLMHLKGCNRDCGEAADEIERLREAITAMAEEGCDQRNEIERLRTEVEVLRDAIDGGLEQWERHRD